MNRKGFTMVELLVVLLIVGILAAIATPLFLAHTKRARASEAVATMSQVRQSLRDYNVSHPDSYFDINRGTTSRINLTLPTSVATGVPTPAASGVDVNAGVAQYFSNACYSVDATTPAWPTNVAPGNPTDPVDFVIIADGTTGTPGNVACTAASEDCAVHNTEVSAYRLAMDNSGRIFVSYDSGAANSWSAW